MEPITDSRQRIINSARDLIYARSYSDVGVQEICEHAEVKKGSFYHFFPSKRDLTLAVLDQLQIMFRDEVISKALSKDIPPLARITRFFDLASDFQAQIKANTGRMYGCPFGNLASELSTRDEPIRIKIDQIFRDTETPFAQTLAEAVNKGDLPDIDTVAAAQSLFAYIEGVMLVAKTRNDPELIRKLGKRALQLVLAGHVN